MKRKLYISLALAIMLSLLAIPAFASPPTNASGIWYYIPTEPTFIKESGGNQFFDLTEAGIWTGTFEGTSVDYGPVVMYRSGATSFKGIVDFEGEVEGKTGTLTIKVNGRKTIPTAEWEGQWVIISGGGDLSDLNGQGKWWGPGYNPADPLTHGVIYYSGEIH
jgi:hypothetical protein